MRGISTLSTDNLRGGPDIHSGVTARYCTRERSFSDSAPVIPRDLASYSL
jgi:hypothetical protein